MKKRIFTGKAHDKLPSPFSGKSYDNALTFLIGQLEYLDPIIADPLHAETYARDLYVKTGAGWVESTSFRNVLPAGVSIGVPGSNKSNSIKRIGVDLTKTPTPVFTYKSAIGYDVEELNKAAHAGVNIDDLMTRMLRIDYEKTCDMLAYVGSKILGMPGLLANRSGVTCYNVPKGAGDATTTWLTKTQDEILTDLRTIILTFWRNTGYSKYPNTIGVPPTQFEVLTRPLNALGNRSILDYFMENNIVKMAGQKLSVVPMKWCTQQTIEGKTYGGSGGAQNGASGSFDRMVAYINAPENTRFHMPVPLTREDVTKVDLGISVPYIGLIGGVEIVHTETIIYADKI
jgi:hypothetical protein